MKKEKTEIYYPPKEVIEVAEMRTSAIIRRWGHNTKASLSELAISTYLQGIEDTVTVLQKSRAVPHRLKLNKTKSCKHSKK